MNVAHRFFINNPELEDAAMKDISIKLSFTNADKFVRNRLQVLKSEIDYEESLQPEFQPCTIIELYSENGKAISFNGYSADLRSRMLASFSEDDFKFLCNQSENMLGTFDN